VHLHPDRREHRAVEDGDDLLAVSRLDDDLR
jgi:hypothetical protein